VYRRLDSLGQETMTTFRSVAFGRVAVLVLLVYSLHALAVAIASSLQPHRQWAVVAMCGYLVALLVAVLGRPAPAAMVAMMASTLLPMVILSVLGSAQSEVRVVARGARLLVDTGTPYLHDPGSWRSFNPYLPLMSLFGLLRVLGGSWVTDPRVWMAAAFACCMVLAYRASPRRRVHGRQLVAWLSLLVACPFIAMPIAVSGVDVVPAGLMLLGLVLSSRGQPVRAGVVVGLACGLKVTAWPLIVVTAVLVWVVLPQRSRAEGVGKHLAAAVGTLVVAVLPALLVDPVALWRNCVAYPFGLTDFASPAGSPFPGVLLARHVDSGTLVDLCLLGLAALVVLLVIVRRPPGDLISAADIISAALTAAIFLAPASRFGYLIYPLLLSAGARILSQRTSHVSAAVAPGVAPRVNG